MKWKEQSYSQRNGDFQLWRIHFVCDIDTSNPNNWLRLPFVPRENANRLIIKLDYTIRECKKYPGEIRSCKETFQLLYTEADESERAPDFAESNYQYLKTIAPSSVSKQQTSNSLQYSSSASTTLSSSLSSSIFRAEIELTLRTKKHGVYLVFRDQGACVSILSIKILYTLCPQQIFNLAVFPLTPTGSNVTDLVQRVGTCVPNSDAKSTPHAYCQGNGHWFLTNDKLEGCTCRPGFFFSPSTDQCLGKSHFFYNFKL